jgi:hypothetical protein
MKDNSISKSPTKVDDKEMISILPNTSEMGFTPTPPSASINDKSTPSPSKRSSGKTLRSKLVLKNAVSLISEGSISGDNVSIKK